MTTTRKSTTEALDTLELFALARLAVERNDLEDALLKLKQVLASADPSADVMALAARVYAQLGLFERAEKLYERFLDKQPGSVVERFQLGMTRLDGGKPSQALETWEKILKDQPTHPPALFYKSLVLAQSGKVAEARQSLDALLKSAPADNLYFGRAKELLHAIESGRSPGPSADKGGNGGAKPTAVLPPDAYRTEH